MQSATRRVKFPKYDFNSLLGQEEDEASKAYLQSAEKGYLASASSAPTLRQQSVTEASREETPVQSGLNYSHHLNMFAKSTTSSATIKRHATPGTSGSDAVTKSVIVAVAEGRGLARGDVGMAAFDLRNPELVLSQFSDNQTYTNSIMKLQVYDPLEIVMPSTAFDRNSMPHLSKQIDQHMPGVTISSIDRKYFSESAGIQYIRDLCLPECSSVEMEVSSMYYALSAGAALIKYIEFIQSIVLSSKSLKVVFKTTESTTRIDAATSKNLELIANIHSPKTNASLFSILNFTKTHGGTRLLRRNVLQPPCDLNTILVRQEVIKELLNQEELHFSLQGLLQKFLNLEYLLTLCVQMPKQETLQTMDQRLNSVIALKYVLELVEPLKVMLNKSTNLYLKTAAMNIAESISAVVHEEVSFKKGSLNKLTQKCYAVKPYINGLLDVTRRIYSELVDDILALVHQLGEEYNLPLHTSYSPIRGYYIEMPANIHDTDIPKVFIKITKKKNMYSFTTDDLTV